MLWLVFGDYVLILCRNWLVVVCALVVFFKFCVHFEKELVGCGVCFGCLLMILCGFGERTCWLLCFFGCPLLILCGLGERACWF